MNTFVFRHIFYGGLGLQKAEIDVQFGLDLLEGLHFDLLFLLELGCFLFFSGFLLVVDLFFEILGEYKGVHSKSIGLLDYKA